MVIWRGLGGHTLKNVGKIPNSWTDQDQIWHTYCMHSSGNGHELNKLTLRYPRGMGVRGSSIKKSGISFQTTGPIGTKFGTQIHQGMDI